MVKKKHLFLLLCMLMAYCLDIQAQGKLVTVNFKNTEAAVALQEIEKQSGVKMQYSYRDLNFKVSYSAKKADAVKVVRDIVEPHGFTVKVEKNYLRISSRQAKGSYVSSGPRRISGIVVDETGEPLIGATVKSMKRGQEEPVATATDLKGTFSLMLDGESSELEISYIGYDKKVVTLTSSDSYRIQMEANSLTLNEVSVISNGMFTRNSESFTGSTATYTSDKLKAIGNQNVLQSLSALDPSFLITDNNQQGANPNAMLDVNINGKISINGLSDTYESNPDQPLFILDGFETTLQRISDLSMDRIESITILKDAASTAIYGAKAANGVVVVETKKPETGKLRFSYTGNYQLGWADLSDYDLMNSAEKLQFEKLAGYYGTLDKDGEILNDSQRSLYYSRMKLVSQGVDSYWMNEPLRTAFTHDHSFDAEGGDQAFRYGLTFRLKNTEGVMKNSDRRNIDGTLNLSYRILKFNFSNQMNVYYTKANNNVVPFRNFSEANPYYSKFDENNQPYRVLQSWQEIDGTHYAYNPLWDFGQKSFDKSNQLAVNNNLNIEYRPIDQLRFVAKLGFTVSRDDAESFTSPFASQFMEVEQLKRGLYRHQVGNATNYDGSILASYGDVVGKHTYNIVGGAQLMQQHNKSDNYAAYGYITDMFSNPNFSNSYPEGGKPSSNVVKTRSASFYLNANYAYDLRYLLDLNVRTDGTSVFGVNNPFSSTWSFGVAWNIHNEKWFKRSETLNQLKLRYSLGNPGFQSINAKLANSIYTYYTSYPNMFGLAALVNRWGNKNLKWQRTTQHNIGVNLEMFKNRLYVTADYTIRKTDPILLSIEQPPSTGASSVPMNIGATDNKSFSVSARYTVIRNKNLTWLLNANVLHTTTKYDKIGDLLERMNQEGRASQTLLRYYDGVSATALWAVKSMGIDPMTGNEVFMKPDGSYTFKWNSSDEVICGDMNPDIQGNFGTTLRYKGFSLTTSFRYRFGGQEKLTTLLNKVENISNRSLKYNQDRRALYDRWQKPGDIAKFKRIDDTSVTNLSSRFIADDNTVECQSIALGYETTKARWLRPLCLSAFNFRIYINDIFRISTIKEERGVDYPFQRSVSASLGLRF